MGGAAAAVRAADALGPRYGARIPSTVAVMGGIRGSAPRDRAVRGYFDHRRNLLRDGATGRGGYQKPPPAAARDRRKTRDLPPHLGKPHRYARRPSRRRLRKDRSGLPGPSRGFFATPDQRMDRAMGEGQDARSAADGKAWRVVLGASAPGAEAHPAAQRLLPAQRDAGGGRLGQGGRRVRLGDVDPGRPDDRLGPYDRLLAPARRPARVDRALTGPCAYRAARLPAPR